jgi:hypothetical protein
MRNVVAVVVLVVAVGLSVGSAQQQQPAQPPAPYGQDPTGCDVACNHYMQCKGIHDDNMYSQCIQGCQPTNPNRQQMYDYAQLDCPTAVSIIDNGGSPASSGSAPAAGAGGPGPGDKECQGCKKWDDQCAYIVETAVGSGPYSGAVTDCAPTCCP